MARVFCSVDGLSDMISASITQSHSAATSIALLDAHECSLEVGDEVVVDMGYSDNHAVLFRGYVKQVDRKTPSGVYSVTCQDKLIRAVDYFIVSSTPTTAYKVRNISAEDLVGVLLDMAGLTDYDGRESLFTLGTRSNADINLVSSYDICKHIADLLAWHIYCDRDGTIHFLNRKPHVMTGTSGQIGDVADVPVKEINVLDPVVLNRTTLELTYDRSEKDLRNKVVVYGAGSISATAQASSPYLPDGFYKAVVVASPYFDTQALAQTSADYNLAMLNRLTESCSLALVGDPDLEARSTITLTYSDFGISGDWYIFQSEHRVSSDGYITSLELRR